jgi:phage shock protein E
MTLENWIEDARSGKGTRLDVRTREEVLESAAPDTLNIPLAELPEHLEKIRGFETPLYVFCKSGARSESAIKWLVSQGVSDVHNIGSWKVLL